jgi:hypothetical protein
MDVRRQAMVSLRFDFFEMGGKGRISGERNAAGPARMIPDGI